MGCARLKRLISPLSTKRQTFVQHFPSSLSLKLIKTINLAWLLLRGEDVQYPVFIVAASVLALRIATRGDEMEKQSSSATRPLAGGKSDAKA